MPALKYWDGAAWQRLPLQGAAPSAPAVPPIMGQPGTVVLRGSANITDLNTNVGGLYDVTTCLMGSTWPHSVAVFVVAGMWAGYGGSDTAFSADIWALGPNALASATPGTVHCHGGYWTACPIVASWQVGPGVDAGFKVRLNYQAGSNIHTGGAVNYLVAAV